MYVCMCTCMATIHLHQKGSDGSADRLVPWLHKDCPAWASGVIAERGSLVLLGACPRLSTGHVCHSFFHEFCDMFQVHQHVTESRDVCACDMLRAQGPSAYNRVA